MEGLRQRPLAVLAAALAGSAFAQQPPPTAAAGDPALPAVVVTATRAGAEAHKVPATITSLTRRALDAGVAADEAELFRNDPDIAFGRDARRFGATRPNIRGIDDNRVLQMVDGVRLPAWYNGGGPTNFTMNAPLGVSPEFLKRVEILRGPASSLYGSDAIGGVVGWLTLDPEDLLAQGQRLGGRARLAYAGANEAATATVLGAGRGEATQWLLGLTQTDAHEFDNQGSVEGRSATRTRPNPQDLRDRAFIGKLALALAPQHTLRLAAEAREQDGEVQVLRLAASLPKVSGMSGDDHTQRVRVSAEWEHAPGQGWYDRLTAKLYRQRSKTDNHNLQARTNTSATCSAAAGTGNDCRVEQDFFFTQTVTGASLQLESAPAGHLLTYGLDAARVSTEELRDARIWNLTTGNFSRSLAGDSFPLRDFAPGHTDTVGVFLQDEIGPLAGGRLMLVPGLRYDWRALKARPDALSQAVLGSIGKQAVSQTDGALSPKLAATWQFTPALAAYGQLARGFRAPNYEEVNGHFRNSAQSYGISPNPNLRPETSTSVEAGLRVQQAGVKVQLSAFDNRYRNFITSTRLACPQDPNCIAGLGSTLMSVNLSKARIHGAEARLAWEVAPGWQLQAAAAHARGTDQSSGQPLDSVEPTRAVLGVARDAGAWGAQAHLRAAARVKRVNDSGGAWFRPPGYGVTDLAAWWRPTQRVRLTLAVDNAFDKTYWQWSDIRLADARNPAGVDFYSQPGRQVSARMELSF